MDYLIISAMRMRKRHLFCTSSHHNVPYEKQQKLNKGSEPRSECPCQRACAIVKYVQDQYTRQRTTRTNIQRIVLYIQKLVPSMSRAEWMNGICLIWSRGRLIPPSLPACRRRQLSEPQLTKATHGPKSFGTTLWHHVHRYCCLGVLFAHAQGPSNTSSYHIRENEMNCIGASEYMTVFTSFKIGRTKVLYKFEKTSLLLPPRPSTL